MFKKIICATILFATLNAFAHEGHDQTPGSLKANHGGTVKAGKEFNLEYVVSGNELKLYPASHEGSDLLATEVKISGTGKLPKGKAESLKIELKNGIYTAPIDFKSGYRIEVIATTEYKGKKDSFKFQVEK
ncbi:hypothetical protein CIK05_10965 [Bdellovibrio sp. qaytius]|nr:hypothetical protein CIK05_10965 [Bdellovibrio sp. qaytius]